MQNQGLADAFGQATQIVAFTGAGISAESGVPTYRGSGGMWNVYDPDKYAHIDYFYKDPSYYWQFFRDIRYPSLQKAQANAAHYALTSLEEAGLLRAVITQNIDGLHQAAGTQQVLELHGTTRVYTCLGCSKQFSMDQAYAMIQTELPPKCPQCQGLIRPGTVMFGEALPMTILEKAEEMALCADHFLCIGSSLVVQPAASFPVIAKKNGARLVIINQDPTPLDDMADLVLHERASEGLVSAVQMCLQQL